MNIQYIVSPLAVIATILGTYFIFQKAGEEGWKAIIPFYNAYTEYKLVWNTKMFWSQWIAILASAALFLSTFILPFFAPLAFLSMVSMTIWPTPIIACVIIHIMKEYKLSQYFGHGKWFCVGLVFFAPIFRCILGFDQAERVMA